MKVIQAVAGCIIGLICFCLLYQDCNKIEKSIVTKPNFEKNVAQLYTQEIEQLRKKCEWANSAWKNKGLGNDWMAIREFVLTQYPNCSPKERRTVVEYILCDGSKAKTCFTIDNVIVLPQPGGEYVAFPPNRCSYVFPDYYYRVDANGKITRIKE